MVHENGLEQALVDGGKGLLFVASRIKVREWHENYSGEVETVSIFKIIGTNSYIGIDDYDTVAWAGVDSPSDAQPLQGWFTNRLYR
jgi:hypothetical protein